MKKKKIGAVLSCVLLAAGLVAGCGSSKESGDAATNEATWESIPAATEATAPTEKAYSGSITFTALDEEITEEGLAEIGDIMVRRAQKDDPARDCRAVIDAEARTVTLEVDASRSWIEQFVLTAADQDLLEFREGKSASAEPFLTNAEIEDAYVNAVGSSKGNTYTIFVKFSTKGANTLRRVTGDMAEKGTSLTVWYNGELFSSSTVAIEKTDGRIAISSDLDEQAANVMAIHILNVPLPYEVEITGYSAGVQ